MGIDANMYAVTKEPITSAEVNRWSIEVAEAFGADMFWIDKEKEEPHHCLTLTRHNELNVISVNTFVRYYGEGYERGPFPFLYALAKWLEARIPGASILYGGDAYEMEEAHPFGETEREELFAHFARVGHRPYSGDPFKAGSERNPYMNHDSWANRSCSFCKVSMIRYGYGATFAGLRCSGCGLNERTKDSGMTWTVEKERD